MNNEFDDFFVSPMNNFENLYEDYQLYQKCLSALPVKVTSSVSFNKVALFDEVSHSKALYRKSNNASDFLSIYWLSQLRLEASKVLSENPIPKLSFTKNDLLKLVEITKTPEKIIELPKILYEYGIILLFKEYIPGMKVDGVTFLFNESIPVIGMTLRYDRYDNFWFTLFHELAHVILHYDKLKDPLFDDIEDQQLEDIEMEANNLTLNSFVPRYKWRSCKLKYNPKKEYVYELAEELAIHPAIIAGRYRKETGNYSIFTDIVTSINTREILL